MKQSDTQHNNKANEFAQALLAAPMTQREREEWAVFSMAMTNEQIDEFIELLKKQSVETKQALEEMKKNIIS